VFQSSASAAGQQVSFSYHVRDSHGGQGTGVVRIAVSAADTATAPVAYTDRVRLRQDDPEWATLEPLLNDRDPSGGDLRVIAVRPDAPNAEGNPEWERLEGLVDTSQMGEGKVLVRAGDVPGNHAYVYTVRSSATGSTAEGLLVVEVTPSPVIDPPEVKDTTVTAALRSELQRTGIDVVTGKVSWPGGDVSQLTLELWEPGGDYSVSGGAIRGPAPKSGGLVPFTLRGTDRLGREVVSHAFLFIPSFDDFRVSPDPNARVVQVEEAGSVKIPVANRVALAAGDKLEVDTPKSFPVQRRAASCVPGGGATVVYDAGDGEPWTDTCVVRVRLDGQTTWTDLVIPIQIKPKAAQPLLASTSRTVPPGATETIDLKSLTTWEGNRVGDESKLIYSTDLASDKFTLVQQGSKLTITASAAAVPGTRSSVNVHVAAFGGLHSTIDLVVGQAAPDVPRGATVDAVCEASRATCSVPLIGVTGEYDPFAGKPGAGLTLASVANTCSFVSISAADKSATITWPSGARPAGGKCQVSFTVRDAQERSGNGTLRLELPGYPDAPRLSLYDVSSDYIIFDIVAAASYPEAKTMVLYGAGSRVADCGSVSRCQITGLTPNRKVKYTVRAQNTVGESVDSNEVEAWAYKAPDIRVTAVQDKSRQPTETMAWVTVTVDVLSGEAQAFDVGINGLGKDRRTSPFPYQLPVGPSRIWVTPVGAVEPPGNVRTLPDGSDYADINVIGMPIDRGLGYVDVNGATATVRDTLILPNGADKVTYIYAMSTRSGLGCDEAGNPIGGDIVQTNQEGRFTMDYNKDYWFGVCGSNGYGTVGGQVGSGGAIDKDAPTVGRYEVNTTSTVQGNTRTYSLKTEPSVTAPNGMQVQYLFPNGDWTGDFRAGFDSYQGSGTILVRLCGTGMLAGLCTATSEVRPVDNGAPSRVQVTVEAPVQCDAHPFRVTFSSAAGSASPSAPDAEGKITWVWTWSGAYSKLESLQATTAVDCRPDDVGPPDGGGGGEEEG
ncbi:MAG: hypothetical protein FWD11_08790, partial [Micrococcales bacterium]|nr:hypothetical protein [Micrococcales bacterium]